MTTENIIIKKIKSNNSNNHKFMFFTYHHDEHKNFEILKFFFFLIRNKFQGQDFKVEICDKEYNDFFYTGLGVIV